MNRRDTLKSAAGLAALVVLPYASQITATKIAQDQVLKLHNPDQGDFVNAKYWSFYSGHLNEPEGMYFDLVDYHNYVVRHIQALQTEYPDQLKLTHASVVSNHPDYFADFSQGLVWTRKPINEMQIEWPHGLNFNTYDINDKITPEPLTSDQVAQLKHFYKPVPA